MARSERRTFRLSAQTRLVSLSLQEGTKLWHRRGG